jgi:hypothetical protein
MIYLIFPTNVDNLKSPLIFEGYIIPYRVDALKENIVILGIFSENEWKL